VLEAGDECRVLKGAGGGDCFEEVAYHRAVDADVFFFGGLAQPCGDEDVGGFEMDYGGAEGGRIEEVGGDEVYARDVGGGAAGQAVDLPAFGEEVMGEVVSDDAGDSGDECGWWHLVLWVDLGIGCVMGRLDAKGCVWT